MTDWITKYAQEVDELLKHVLQKAEHFRSRLDVPDALASLDEVAKTLGEISAVLQRRAPEVTTALNNLAAARHRLRFQPSVWPAQQEHLKSALVENLDKGLSTWLTLWATAISEWRLEAAQRIADSPIGLPSAAALIRERLSFATETLRAEQVAAAMPTLQAIARGAVLGGRSLVATLARGSLHLLLVRLLLEQDASETDMRAELGDAADLLGETVSVVAARAYVARATGAVDEFQRLVSACRGSVSSDLGALVEQVQLTADNDPAALDEVLEEGVAPLLARGDVVSEVERLRQKLPAALSLRLCKEALDGDNIVVAEYALSHRDSTWRPADVSVAYELAAELYRRQGRTPSEIARMLILAGDEATSIDYGDPVRARRMYEEALGLDPDAKTTIRLAAALYDEARTLPLVVSREQLKQARNLIEEARTQDLVEEDGWSHIVEYYILTRLADEATAAAEEESWAAALAILRALVLNISAPDRWAILSSALRGVNLYELAARTARHAVDLAPYNETALEAAVSAITNVGRYEEALELLDRLTPTPWRAGVRGYTLLRQGRAEEAFAILRDVALVGEAEYWWWVWYSSIDSANASGNNEWAWQAASRLWKLARQRPSETEAWEAGAFAALELGKLKEVQARARKVLTERDPRAYFARELLGSAQILLGDPESGIQTLLDMIDVAYTVSNLDEVETLMWPRLTRLARRQHVILPEFHPLGSAIARAKQRIESTNGGLREMDWPDNRSLSRLVLSWLAAALAYAESNFVLAQRLADDLSWEGKLPELDHFRALVSAAARVSPDESSAVLRDSAGSTLLAADSREAEPGDGDSDDERPEYPIAVALPPSWLDDYKGRELLHPIFLEYLPRVRANSGGSELPSVRVVTDLSLEPASYRIEVNGAIAESGTIDVHALFCLSPALHLLERAGVHVRAEPSPLLPELVTLSTHPSILRRSMFALLLMTPEEVIVRRIPLVLRPTDFRGRGNDGETADFFSPG
jgi:tetratricopeptide (TPR) repeat protein